MLSRSAISRSTCACTRMLSTGLMGRASFGRSQVPKPINEPLLDYRVGSQERKALREAVDAAVKSCPEIPCVIAGKHVKSDQPLGQQFMPCRKDLAVATFHTLDETIAGQAVQASIDAKASWQEMPFEDRAAIFLKAADLLSGKYRAEICARTIVGQGKNVWQAEIDASVETADFLRFNVKYAEELYGIQPTVSKAPGVWNRMEHRPLEGFVVAISPFNFTAIGANLACAPVLMGNTCIWKPSDNAVLSNYLIYQIFEEAGLPAGVINFVPGDGAVLGKVAFRHPDLGGIHFTGSTKTFNTIWKDVAMNIDGLKSYPRVVGETGGKNFHFVHESANLENAVYQTIRGAFEYQGQKCSATSRLYVPDTMWKPFRKLLIEQLATIKQGCTTKFDTFVGAVINQRSFDKISAYIDRAKASDQAQVIAGGKCDDSSGFFIEPTVIEANDPNYETMVDELFGPVLSVYVYEASRYKETLALCESAGVYGLTGAVFANDRAAQELASNALRNAAGNFYLNDKCTGAIVGQQAFGGSRKSGTNDKSGSMANLLRWTSTRTIKENFVPLQHYSYPHMA